MKSKYITCLLRSIFLRHLREKNIGNTVLRSWLHYIHMQVQEPPQKRARKQPAAHQHVQTPGPVSTPSFSQSDQQAPGPSSTASDHQQPLQRSSRIAPTKAKRSGSGTSHYYEFLKDLALKEHHLKMQYLKLKNDILKMQKAKLLSETEEKKETCVWKPYE